MTKAVRSRLSVGVDGLRWFSLTGSSMSYSYDVMKNEVVWGGTQSLLALSVSD